MTVTRNISRPRKNEYISLLLHKKHFKINNLKSTDYTWKPVNI